MVNIILDNYFQCQDRRVSGLDIRNQSTPKDLTQKSKNENLFSNYFDLSDSDSDIAPDMSNKIIKLKEEIDRYNIIVNNPVKEKTSKIFQQNNSKAIPLLNELALTLLNIPSSSSLV